MPRKGWPLAPAFGGCGLDGAGRSAEVCLQEIDGEVWPRCNFKPLVFSQFQTALDTLAERTRTMCLPRPDALRLAASRCRVGTAPCCIQWSRDNNLGTDHACHFLGQSHTTGKELAPPSSGKAPTLSFLGVGAYRRPTRVARPEVTGAGLAPVSGGLWARD